jgi:hypothetical protein
MLGKCSKGAPLEEGTCSEPFFQAICKRNGRHANAVKLQCASETSFAALSQCKDLTKLELIMAYPKESLSHFPFQVLGKLPIRQLSLVYSANLPGREVFQILCPWDDKLVGNILSQCPLLTHLTLNNVNQIDGSCFAHLLQLTHLSLVFVDSLDPSHFDALLSRLTNSLRKLSLEFVVYPEDEILASVSRHSQLLQELRFECCNYDFPSFFSSFDMCIRQMTNLTSLALPNCFFFGRTQVHSLCYSPCVSTIQHLDLRASNIIDDDLILLSHHCFGLITLNLFACPLLSDASIITLLKTNRHLRQLGAPIGLSEKAVYAAAGFGRRLVTIWLVAKESKLHAALTWYQTVNPNLRVLYGDPHLAQNSNNWIP